MNQKLSFSFIIAVGFMLFALFFGAGNLIFPAMLGQSAGTNIWWANAGFVVTGVGLPLLGVIALGISGKDDLQSLASRVHPIFGLIFTVALYLSIGPLFAIPRTGTVSYEIGIKPFIAGDYQTLSLVIFTIIFFGITAFFSMKSSKIVDIVGKFLTPILLVFIGILIVTALINPMGAFQAPTENYLSDSFFKGFQEGYLTMDALASFVFGIIVIEAIRSKGVTGKKDITKAILKAGLIAAGLLAIIYTSLGLIGASSVENFGLLANGGEVLTNTSNHYFGSFGGILLSLIVLGACLTTSIGLITSCAAYFNKLLPSLSYNTFVIIFSAFSTILANFGLNELIAFSVPVLVAIYPLAICLMILTFTHSLFQGRKEVYQFSVLLTFIVSLFDGLAAAEIKVSFIDNLFTDYLPLYSVGLGWLIPAIIGGLLGYMISIIKTGGSADVNMKKSA
ncbi:branched-chain amino acid transport system II carrier protein [Cytobacillus gottheilii]|uniref:Branched-chain amino acid transport system carrier protein n=1 Tax=Cytobacillus gottheilii TaxID=859144 RepID=A0ABX8F6V9_9BACI|nr:branched-chain amino acid transport system II carrier protein [Cytobacillus gottheilii]QVY59709.1 branched-chain amino acid transport system II carrier protein [Cytobacillus gottheilii]